MDKVNVLIKTLEPEIELKCAEIRRRKNENLFNKNIRSRLHGTSYTSGGAHFLRCECVYNICADNIFGGGFATSSPFLINKGGRIYE